MANAGLKAGTLNEIVLNAATSNIVISARVHNQNNGSTAASLTVLGENTRVVELSAAGNTYSGATYVNVGLYTSALREI